MQARKCRTVKDFWRILAPEAKAWSSCSLLPSGGCCLTKYQGKDSRYCGRVELPEWWLRILIIALLPGFHPHQTVLRRGAGLIITSNVKSPKHLPVFQDKVVSDTVSLVFSPLLLLFPSPKISPLRSHHLFQKTDEQKMENVFQLHYIWMYPICFILRSFCMGFIGFYLELLYIYIYIHHQDGSLCGFLILIMPHFVLKLVLSLKYGRFFFNFKNPEEIV